MPAVDRNARDVTQNLPAPPLSDAEIDAMERNVEPYERERSDGMGGEKWHETVNRCLPAPDARRLIADLRASRAEVAELRDVIRAIDEEARDAVRCLDSEDVSIELDGAVEQIAMYCRRALAASQPEREGGGDADKS